MFKNSRKEKEKNVQNKTSKKSYWTKIEKMIDKLIVEKNFDFYKINFTFSWKDIDFITTYTKNYKKVI